MTSEEPLVYTIDRVALPRHDSPFLEPLLAQSDLTDGEKQAVRDFATKGYAKIPAPMVDDFDARADRIIANLKDRYPSPNRRVQNAWRFDQDVKAIATSERVMSLLRVLYGREPIPFQTLNFDVGTEQALHSDLVHFDSIPRRFVAGVWVALEDIDGDNGPILYSPGSHRLQDAHSTEIGLPPIHDAYPHYATYVKLLVEHLGLPVEEAHLKRGEALIWAANLLHGGKKILDPSRTRHSQVTHYYFENCTYYIPRLSQHPGRLRFREVLDIRTDQLIQHWHAGGPLDIYAQEWVMKYEEDDEDYGKGSGDPES